MNETHDRTRTRAELRNADEGLAHEWPSDHSMPRGLPATPGEPPSRSSREPPDERPDDRRKQDPLGGERADNGND